MFSFFARWLRRKQRAIDVAILWPQLKEQAPTIEHARRAFECHVQHDPAWAEMPAKDMRDTLEGLM